jgi:hypothetical protein
MTAMGNAEQICSDIYAETRAFYAAIAPRMGSAACGFKILYSPPFERPPLMLIGYQPGGDKDDDAHDQDERVRWIWPSSCYYADRQWPIAQRLRAIFGEATLERCVALNALFIRAPNTDVYQHTVDHEVRERISRFCLPRVERIIHASEPQRIVIIGFETLRLLGGGYRPVLSNGSGRVLLREGTVHGGTVTATLHLTGSRIASEDIRQIAEYLRSASAMSRPSIGTQAAVSTRPQAEAVQRSTEVRSVSSEYSRSYVPASDIHDAHRKGYVITNIEPNPKQPGSKAAARYDKYRTGMTIDEALNAGLRMDDLQWDVRRNFITLGPRQA